MDKPVSMSVKDFLIRTLAVKILKSEKMIEAVINHQFQSANEAMDGNNSIEISGFGKFYYNNKKGDKKLNSLNAKVIAFKKIIEDESTSEAKRKSAQLILDKTLSSIELLKTKTTYED